MITDVDFGVNILTHWLYEFLLFNNQTDWWNMSPIDALKVCLHLLLVLDKIKTLKFIATFHDNAPQLMFFN